MLEIPIENYRYEQANDWMKKNNKSIKYIYTHIHDNTTLSIYTEKIYETQNIIVYFFKWKESVREEKKTSSKLCVV